MPLSISPTGSGGFSAGNPNLSGSASFNPFQGSVGVGAQGGSGDVHAGVGVGFKPSQGTFGVSPTITIGHGQNAQVGGAIGGAAGTAIGAGLLGPPGAIAGSAIGSAIGSTVGSLTGNLFGSDKYKKEHKQRDSVVNSFKQHGIFDADGSLQLPDGSTFIVGQPGTEGQHGWKNPQKRVDKEGDRPLFNFETDYTNDMDYVASMAGTTLSRLVSGGKNKAVDQTGQQLGNAFLGKVGYGADLNNDNFSSVMTNARATYAKSGIETKEDLLALANKAFSEGRINDADYAVAQQTAGLVFDNNYNSAQSLMSGRWKGVSTASESPANANPQGQSRSHGSRSPIVSPEEALLSLKPFFDMARQMYPIKRTGSHAGVNIAQGVGLVTSGIGIYNALNNATGGGIGDALGSGASAIGDLLGLTDAPSELAPVDGGTSDVPDYTLPGDSPDLSLGDLGSSGGDSSLGSFDFGAGMDY